MPHKWEKLTPCPLPNCAKPTQHRRSLESATHINKHMESLRTRKRNRGVCFLINCWEDIVLSSLLPKCHRAIARLCAFISMLFAGSKLVFLLQHGVFTQDLWVQRAWATWVRGSSGTTEAPCFFGGGGGVSWKTWWCEGLWVGEEKSLMFSSGSLSFVLSFSCRPDHSLLLARKYIGLFTRTQMCWPLL